MNKTLPIILWIMVFIFGGLTLFYMKRDDPSTTSTSAPLTVKPEEGTAYQQIPWKHFPNVTPFKLTNQLGEEFDSAELAGLPASSAESNSSPSWLVSLNGVTFGKCFHGIC